MKKHTHRLTRKGFLANYDVHCMIQYQFQPRIAVLCLRLSSGMLGAVPSRYQSLETQGTVRYNAAPSPPFHSQ